MKITTLGFLAIFLSFIAVSGFSQRNIVGLIDAEKRFSSFTASHSIKDGFLKFMDSTGLIFRQGKAMNAIETYQRQNATSAVLSWDPAFAIISDSGDMGATTGPFELRANSLQDTPTGKGSFFSIWRINNYGEWKNVADFGSSHNLSTGKVGLVKEISLAKTNATNIAFDELLILDQQFNEAIMKKDNVGIRAVLSSDSWFNFDGKLPVIGIDQVSEAISQMPAGIIITSSKGELSSSKDFGYVYGQVTYAGKINNYLRAWFYRDGRWQVIVQTMRW